MVFSKFTFLPVHGFVHHGHHYLPTSIFPDSRETPCKFPFRTTKTWQNLSSILERFGPFHQKLPLPKKNWPNPYRCTPPGNDHISHLGKGKIIFKSPLVGNMLVPYRLGLFSHLTISHCHQCFPPLFPPFLFLASISGAPKSRTNKIQPKAKTASMSGFTSKSRQKLRKVKDWRGEFVRICLMKMLVESTQKIKIKKTKNCAINLDPGNASFSMPFWWGRNLSHEVTV